MEAQKSSEWVVSMMLKLKTAQEYASKQPWQNWSIYLLNLAAFEHCHVDIQEALIASYLVFMECLIKTPEDVNYLNRHGIIQHLLGDDTEVVDMFKSVAKEMLTDAHSNRYAKLGDEVNAYCSQRRNRWRASLLRNYFNNPWVIISLVAAVLLLLLTVTQTVYTVWPFYSSTSEQNGN